MAARINSGTDVVPRTGRKPRSSSWLGSAFFGVFLAGLTLAAGTAVIFARPPAWEAQTTLIVLPSEATASRESSDASLFELLNQGQVVTTYAALLQSQIFAEQVTRTAAVRARPVSIDAAPLPDTFLIRITASAPTAAAAARLAHVAAERAPQFVGDLNQPFTVRALDTTAVTATRRSAGTPGLAATLVVVAILVGLAGQQGFLQLRRARQKPEEVSGVPWTERDGPQRRASRALR